VAAWSVCRLGRSLSDLIGLLGELRSRDIDLYLHQQALDTSRPSGRALFGMLGVFSEFERSMIRDRVMAGLDRARSSGKRLGRPRTTPFTVQRIRAALDQGRGVRETARLLKVARPRSARYGAWRWPRLVYIRDQGVVRRLGAVPRLCIPMCTESARHCRERDASRRLMTGLNVPEAFNAKAHGIRGRRALTAYTQQSGCATKVTEIGRMISSSKTASSP
jgi:hypothetical protein